MKGITAETLSAIGLDPERRHTWTRIQNAYRKAWEKSRKVERQTSREFSGGGAAEIQRQRRLATEAKLIPVVLGYIERNPKIYASQIARRVGVSEHNVRSTLFRLEAEGVIRRKDPNARQPLWEIADMVGA